MTASATPENYTTLTDATWWQGPNCASVRFRHRKAGKSQRWGDVSTLITKRRRSNGRSKSQQEELEKRLVDLDLKDGIFKSAAPLVLNCQTTAALGPETYGD
jgi:hypothetical protein